MLYKRQVHFFGEPVTVKLQEPVAQIFLTADTKQNVQHSVSSAKLKNAV